MHEDYTIRIFFDFLISIFLYTAYIKINPLRIKISGEQ